MNRVSIRIIALSAFLSSMFCTVAPAQPPGLVEFFAAGKLQRGMALVELSREMVVIGRDGWLHSLDPNDRQTRIRPLNGKYEPSSAAELRNELRAEFGPKFEVAATKNFLVVQPKGREDRWPDLFEQSHRSFITYMRKRGVEVRQGRFPMVAIVFPDEPSMYVEFRRWDLDVSRVAGLYSNNSNRVMTHDGGHLSMIAATVRHEAAHQSAFNSGVHSRVNDTPKWITEGIGQMFEPPAMTRSGTGSQIRDRINQDSMQLINVTYPGRNNVSFSRAVQQLVGDDTMFDSNKHISNAYAISWAMMFYLAERQPKQFAELLNHTATRPPFQEYTRAERIRDFERIVEMDTLDFSRRVNWFLQSL